MIPSEERPYQNLGTLYIPMEDVRENDDMLFKFPQLKKYKEFKDFGGTPAGELNRDKVIKYINIFYSKGSVLIKRHRSNVVARKEEAAKLAGFDLTKKSELEKIQNDLFALKNKGIFGMVMVFLKLQSDNVWDSIVAREQFYWELQNTVLEPLVGDDENKKIASMEKKSKLFNAKEEQRQALKGLYKEFFGDDFELEQAFKNQELILTSPEEVATIQRKF